MGEEDANVTVSYLMALEKNTNTTFEVRELEDDYRAGVIAHVAGENNLAITVYLGYEHPVVNGFCSGHSSLTQRVVMRLSLIFMKCSVGCQMIITTD